MIRYRGQPYEGSDDQADDIIEAEARMALKPTVGLVDTSIGPIPTSVEDAQPSKAPTSGRLVSIPGYRRNKDGKLVKTKRKPDASAVKRMRTSKRVKVVRRVI